MNLFLVNEKYLWNKKWNIHKNGINQINIISDILEVKDIFTSERTT